MAEDFDSRPNTYEHIQKVQHLLNLCIVGLLDRSEQHDQSKLVEPELTAYNDLAQRLYHTEYGSEAYTTALADQAPAIAHHYANNAHHPEHHAAGIQGMTLLDLLEMACDWEAAAGRHGKHARTSLDYNQQRWGFSDELKSILDNTLKLLEQWQ